MDISTVPMSGPTIYSSFVSSLPGTVHGPFFLVTLWLFTETTILSFANHNVYHLSIGHFPKLRRISMVSHYLSVLLLSHWIPLYKSSFLDGLKLFIYGKIHHFFPGKAQPAGCTVRSIYVCFTRHVQGGTTCNCSRSTTVAVNQWP